MLNDPIVDEIRSIRDAYAKQFNYNIEAIIKDIKYKQKNSNFKYINLPPKRLDQNENMKFQKLNF